MCSLSPCSSHHHTFLPPSYVYSSFRYFDSFYVPLPTFLNSAQPHTLPKRHPSSASKSRDCRVSRESLKPSGPILNPGTWNWHYAKSEALPKEVFVFSSFLFLSGNKRRLCFSCYPVPCRFRTGDLKGLFGLLCQFSTQDSNAQGWRLFVPAKVATIVTEAKTSY